METRAFFPPLLVCWLLTATVPPPPPPTHRHRNHHRHRRLPCRPFRRRRRRRIYHIGFIETYAASFAGYFLCLVEAARDRAAMAENASESANEIVIETRRDASQSRLSGNFRHLTSPNSACIFVSLYVFIFPTKNYQLSFKQIAQSILDRRTDRKHKRTRIPYTHTHTYTHNIRMLEDT